jgi:hypothetical protein
MKTSYFDEVQRGDRVWDFVKGWGMVGITNSNTGRFQVIFDKTIFHDLWITKDGVLAAGSAQRVFWNEIKFELPQKPKSFKKIKVYLRLTVLTNSITGHSYIANIEGPYHYQPDKAYDYEQIVPVEYYGWE